MRPYLSLGFPLLPQPAKKRIVNYLLRRHDVIEQHISSVEKHYNGLSRMRPEFFGIMAPELSRLRLIVTVPFIPFIMYIEPNTELERHVDGPTGARQTAIIDHLFPVEGYAPTLFWDTRAQLQPSFSLHLDEMPAIINLQALHGVTNSVSVPRFNFQMAFDLPYAEVVERHLQGKLFRQVPAWP